MDVEKVIREYLPQIVHLSLATSKDNKPWVCEVHFAYDDDLNLYFRSLTSRRHSREITSNPRVAGNIVVQHPLGKAGVGVYFEGRAELLGAGINQQKAFECLDSRLKLGKSILEDAQKPEGPQFYKITVDKYYVFGSFDDQSSQKYELTWGGGKTVSSKSQTP